MSTGGFEWQQGEPGDGKLDLVVRSENGARSISIEALALKAVAASTFLQRTIVGKLHDLVAEIAKANQPDPQERGRR